MVPDLKTSPICLCSIRDAAMKARGAMGGLIFLSTCFASATAALLRLEKELAQQSRLVEFKTHTLDSLLNIDYSAIEARVMALVASDILLHREEFSAITYLTPATEPVKDICKRKPWLRLQDAYDRQKTRRAGRPKKPRKR